MPLIGKVWGTTELVLDTPFVTIHRLTILPDRQCSLHCHQHKFNAFLVVKGTLKIEVHKKSYDLVDVTVIGPSEITTVGPGEDHRFVSGPEPVEAFELYYPAPITEDIIRRNVGGIADGAK